MARKNTKMNQDAAATIDDTGDYVTLIVAYVLLKELRLSLQVTTALDNHAMAIVRTLTKHVRGARVVAPPVYFIDDAHAAVEFKIYGAQSAQADFNLNQTLEFVREFVDRVELTSTCVAVGAEAAKKYAEGLASAPKMSEALKPQGALAILDASYNVVVAKSPHPHVKRFKKMLSAAGNVNSLDIDVEFQLQGKVMRLPPLPLHATKGHRYAESTTTEIVPLTGYLRRGRIVEVELQGKTMQLEVPEDYSAIVEEASKFESLIRMTLEVYKCTNPCLPDVPLPKILSVDEILGQANLKLVV